MKQLNNPFVIGKYAGKDYFCDREKESDLLVYYFSKSFRKSLSFI